MTMTSGVSDALQALSLSLSAWSKGIDHELVFWKTWLASGGGQYKWDFQARLDPDRPINGLLGEVLKGRNDVYRILDVGAGPLTVVGGTVDGRRMQVSATDPLAEAYSILAAQAGVMPPVKTQFSTAEDLSLFFPSSSFDVVYCQNALDHSFDPVRSIGEMLRVVRVGGMVVLNHSENEAENEKYVGFHQFNFTERNGKFFIWNNQQEVDVGAVLPVEVDLEAIRTDADNKIQVVITKNREFQDIDDTSRHRRRAGEILRSLVSFYTSQAMAALEGR